MFIFSGKSRGFCWKIESDGQNIVEKHRMANAKLHLLQITWKGRAKVEERKI